MSTSISKKAPAFLVKTYEMLQKHQFSETINWNEEGSGFVIYSPQKFTSEVLPLYFKHSNMHSFIRQLNMYGFSKQRTKGQNFYHHPQFVKGHPEMVCEIQRKVQNKGTKNNRESTASIEARLPDINPLDSILRINYLLLMEQAANLRLILNQIQPSDFKDEFQTTMKQYLSCNGRLIQLAKGQKLVDNVQTTREILERVSN